MLYILGLTGLIYFSGIPLHLKENNIILFKMTQFSIYDSQITNKVLQFKSKENTIKVISDFFLNWVEKKRHRQISN